jgi:small GTP-binding protein
MGCKPDPVKKEDEVVNNDIPEYKIIVIGDSGVGKTAIIH